MTDQLKPLRDALEAGPTDGPWAVGNTDPSLFGVKHGNGSEPLGFVFTPSFPERSEVGRRALAVSAYIAAANPATIRALLASLDAAEAVLNVCIATLTDKRIGQWDYMEGSQIYSDFREAADKARAALKGA